MISPAAARRVLIRGGRVYDHDGDVHQRAQADIELDIQELPAVSDCRDALSAHAPDVHVHRKGNLLVDFVQSYGDADAAVEAAPRRLTVDLKQHRGGAHPIEGRGLIISGIEDALSDYEVRIDEIPISPARLCQLIQASRGTRTAKDAQAAFAKP